MSYVLYTFYICMDICVVFAYILYFILLYYEILLYICIYKDVYEV